MRTSPPVQLSIIVVSYNTRDMTLACLDSVTEQTFETAYELIVVDNASGDGSADAISRHGLAPQLIALDDNIGFARANNLAARQAQGRYLLLLNPDTVVTDAAIDTLMAFAQENPAARIWGGRTIFADGSLNPSSCWGAMTPWNLICRVTGLTGLFPSSQLFNGEAYAGWQRDSERSVDIVSGCFFLIERDFWNDLEGFDPAFFMYGEEADLCLRAAKLNAAPMVTPNATIIHYGGASETARSAKMIKLLRAKASLIERHWHPQLVPVGLALNALWPLSRWIATALLAKVTGNAGNREGAEVWRDIWRARAQWRRGYDTSGSEAATVPNGKLASGIASAPARKSLA